MSHVEIGAWLLEVSEDYSQFLDSCNWYTYRLIHFAFEHDEALGGYEVTVALFGLGLRVSYTYDNDTEMRREIKDRLRSIKEIPGAEV